MAILYEETYGTLAAGTAITSSNTIYDLISGSGTITAVTDGVRSSAGRYATGTTATTAQARAPLGSLRSAFFARFYFRVSTLPPAASITMYAARSGATFRADIRLNPAGTLSLRDQNVTTQQSTATVSTGTWHRAEWKWDQTGNTQELRVWLGSNRDSVGTADIILTGTAGGGTADNTIRGICTSIASTSLDIDDDRADDIGYIGPSSQPPPADVGDLFDVTYGTLAAATALTAGNTGYTALEVAAGGSATAVTDGVRSSAGRYAVTTSGVTQARLDLASPESELYWRLYVRIPANPASDTSIAALRNGTSFNADLRVTATGRVQLRDAGTAVATSTSALTPNVWHRLEWHWDRAGGLQEVRLWLGANLHGTVTQSETLTGAATSALTTADNTMRGISTAQAGWNVDIDDDKASDTTWVGPSVVTAGAALLREGFEGGAAAAAVTTANSDFTAVLSGGTGTGTATFDVLNVASGAQSGKLVSAAGDTVVLRHDLTALASVYWWREYLTLAALPGVITTLAEAKLAATSAIRGQVQVNTSGTLRLRNVTTLVGTTAAALAAGQMARVEWSLDTAAGLQRLRLFVGGNVHGTVPDEEISGALTAGNTFDRLDIGNLTVGALTSWVDEVATDDTTWLGPTATPATPAGVVATGIGLPVFTTPGAPAPPPPGTSELDSLYRPTGGKIIWGAIPAAMGTQAINTANLAALESMTGRRMDAVRIFKTSVTGSWFAANSVERVMGDGDAAGGRIIVLSFKTSPWTPDQVIAGSADADLAARCADVNTYGKPCFVCCWHEPEGPGGEDMPAATFNALQKKVGSFFKARCPNARYVVIYMGFQANNAYVRASWPDSDTAMDAAVDWIGADPYAFRSSGGAPQSVSSILADFMVFASGGGKASKPIMLAEWGCADDPSNGVIDAGAGKSAWYDAAGAWMRDNANGQRIKLACYYHSPGTVTTTPVNSTFNGYTATSPTRSSSPTANSLEAWKRISAFPRTVVNLGF